MVEAGLALYVSSRIVAPLGPGTAINRSCADGSRSPLMMSCQVSPSTSPTAVARSAVWTECCPSSGILTCSVSSP